MIEAQISKKNEELKKMYEDFTAKMKSEFAQITKFLFEHTEIQAVIWNQYTPSFNDGEPCKFRMNDAIFIRHGFDSEDLMSADNYEADDVFGTVDYSSYRKTDDPLAPVCVSFNKFLYANKDTLESMFGNYGTTVYLTKDGTFEAEYDCGY